MSIFIEQKMNENATSWGWFCVWLKDTTKSFEIHDGKDYAEIKRWKLDKEGNIQRGYISGEELKHCLYQYFIQYCLFNTFYQEIKEIGEDKFMKRIDECWNDMTLIATVEDDCLKIRKY